MLLLLVVLLSSVQPDPVRVAVGATTTAEVDMSPSRLINGGTVRAEDPSIAVVDGRIPVMGSTASVTVTGIGPGETPMVVTLVSGMSVWRLPVGRIVVEDVCDAPTLTLPERRLRVREGQPVTLRVLVSGSEPMALDWVEGGRQLGAGESLEVTLPAGMHLINARAVNRCGAATSDELEVHVTIPRRRATRH